MAAVSGPTTTRSDTRRSALTDTRAPCSTSSRTTPRRPATDRPPRRTSSTDRGAQPTDGKMQARKRGIHTRESELWSVQISSKPNQKIEMIQEKEESKAKDGTGYFWPDSGENLVWWPRPPSPQTPPTMPRKHLIKDLTGKVENFVSSTFSSFDISILPKTKLTKIATRQRTKGTPKHVPCKKNITTFVVRSQGPLYFWSPHNCSFRSTP